MPGFSMLAESAGWLDRAFGLSRVSFADDQTSLGWQHALPAWVWALIVLAAVGLAFWSYSRLLGPRPLRMSLAGVRALLLLLVAALLAGPTLIRQDETIEPDTLLVLLDRSASMQIADMPDPDDPTGRALLSRDQRLQRALLRQAELFDDERLTRQRRIRWMGFGGEAYPIEPALDEDAWPGAEQPATRIVSSIEQALQVAAGSPISGVVLISDGRSPETPSPQLEHRLQQQAIPVFSVPLGAEHMPLELRLVDVDAPRQGFVDDMLPIAATVERLGGRGEIDPASVRLRLIDEATDEVVTERSLAESGFGQPVQMQVQPEEVGTRRWRVEARHEPASPDDEQPMLDTGRSEQRLSVDILDRPIRVLYVEGYPRWEYRYLTSMLTREDSIESSVLLLSADRDFAQEGDRPITRFPREPAEIDDYDVLIFGDFDPGYFSESQTELIRDQVAERGAGLLWIGGERHTPAGWSQAALAELLPMRRPGSVTRLTAEGGRVSLQPTSLATELGLMRLRRPGADEQGAGWPDNLPLLRWGQELGPLKPGAEVLAERADQAEPHPMIVRLRYGAGQSVYVGTDETWRWRYGRGEVYFEQFWIQFVRMLGRERIQQTGAQARLSVSTRRPAVDEPVVVELVLEDPALIDQTPDQAEIEVESRENDEPAGVDQFTVQAEGEGDELRRTFRGVWRPSAGGAMRLRVSEPALAELNLLEDVEVVAGDDELRNPEPDHERLERLATATGGAVVPMDELERLAELVPNRARRQAHDEREPLWHSGLVLGLLLVLLSAEWMLRKVARLV